MKKLLFALFTVSILFVSCSKEEQKPEKSDADIKLEIVGTWQLTHSDVKGEMTAVKNITDYLTFNANGTFHGEGNHFPISSGTYKIDGKAIVVSDNDNDKNRDTYEVLSISKTECTLKLHVEREMKGKDNKSKMVNMDMKIKCKRVK